MESFHVRWEMLRFPCSSPCFMLYSWNGESMQATKNPLNAFEWTWRLRLCTPERSSIRSQRRRSIDRRRRSNVGTVIQRPRRIGSHFIPTSGTYLQSRGSYLIHLTPLSTFPGMTSTLPKTSTSTPTGRIPTPLTFSKSCGQQLITHTTSSTKALTST